VKLTYFGYNAFILEGSERTILLDPGQDLHWKRLNSLIPRDRWGEADLILVTHGDPDHAEYVPEVARVSEAPVVCGPVLARRWQRKGLSALAVAPGECLQVVDVQVQGVKVRHGGLPLPCFKRSYLLKPGFVGVGAVGLHFVLDGHQLLALGDTIWLEHAWNGLRPDILMVPIGGVMTMNVEDALKAAAVIEPKVVIPVHHNWHILFYKHPADVDRFAVGVRKLGITCLPLAPGETTEV
jgi:L-ascorbate metabolism protein UlaG (beta-lactamase superfamily)